MMFIFWGLSLVAFFILSIKFGLFLLRPVFWLVAYLWNTIVSIVEHIVHAYLSLFGKSKILGAVVTMILAAVLYRWIVGG